MTTDKKSSNGNNLNESLQKLVKGTGLVLVGSTLSIFFTFLSGVLIARHWTENELGIFSLAFSILSICVIVSALGMNAGIVRSIAHSRGKNDWKKIPDFITTSVFLSVLASIILGFILFFFSKPIAQNIFNEASLIFPLKTFAIAIPFFALINMIVSIFRGFDNVKPTVYFRYILVGLLFLLLLLGIVTFDLSFINVFYVYLFSIIITFILLVIYVVKQSISLANFSIKSIISPYSKELIFFSLPLLGTSVLELIVSWTDTLMLGGLETSADVGLYNVALPLAKFVSFPLSALLIIFIPILSGLYAKGLLGEIKRNYTILIKWLCSATLPFFIILFLFPGPVINVLFGYGYVSSAPALRILSLVFIINNFTGPCGGALIAMGKSRFILFATLATAILNITLNAILIPSFGFIGAAIATGISVISINLLRILKLYSFSKVQPLSKNLIKPTAFFIVLTIPIYYLSNHFLTIGWWVLLFLLILFYGIFAFSILVTKSLDEEDLKMLLAIERKTGIKSKLIKKLIIKFS